jgi:hypothetical protein
MMDGQNDQKDGCEWWEIQQGAGNDDGRTAELYPTRDRHAYATATEGATKEPLEELGNEGMTP